MQNLPPQLTSQSQPPMDMQSMQGGMLEGYDQMPDEGDEPEKILAHFAPDELPEMDEMQGGILIDPETNLREYTPLNKIFRNPEVREAVLQAISHDRQSQGMQKFAMGGEVEPGRPNDPELEKLRLEGRNGDTELVIITPELLEIFTEWSGKEPDINPMTGFPEFSFFKNFLRIAAPIVGAMFGGPIGAAVAGGLATKVTGGSWGQALGSGALAGLGAGVLSGGGSFLGGGSGAQGGGGFLSGLGNMIPGMGQAGGTAPSVGLNTVGKMLPGSGGQSGGGGGLGSLFGMGQGGMQAAGQSGGGGFLGSLLSNGALPMIGSGLLMAKGHKDEQKGLREYQQQLENRENRERQRQEEMREKHGFNAPLKPVRPFQWRRTNAQPNQDEMERGITKRSFDYDLANPYAQGGAIRGNGKGQQDNIPKKIKENSFIIDASTVSDIGDGSSDAGINELDSYFSKLPSHPMNANNMGNQSKGGYIDALVSNQEFEVTPEQVTALGKGSNEKGAQILKKFVDEIRSKKRTSGERLPPKSKPIGGYLKGIKSSYA